MQVLQIRWEGKGKGKGKETKLKGERNRVCVSLFLNSLFILLLTEERERGSEDYDFASSSSPSCFPSFRPHRCDLFIPGNFELLIGRFSAWTSYEILSCYIFLFLSDWCRGLRCRLHGVLICGRRMLSFPPPRRCKNRLTCEFRIASRVWVFWAWTSGSFFWLISLIFPFFNLLLSA